MEYVYALSGGRKAVIYDEGNNILIVFLNRGRSAQWVILERDYHSNLVMGQFEGELYISYISVAHELVWKKIGEEGRLVLFADVNDVLRLRNINIVSMEKTQYIFYGISNSSAKTEEIRYVEPDGDRKSTILVSEAQSIYDCRIEYVQGSIHLSYRCGEGQDGQQKNFIVTMEGNGRHRLEEYVLCGRTALREHEERCRMVQEQCDKEIRQKQEMYERRLKDEIHNAEQRYKKQYDELADLTKQIQKEGRTWRDLYHKSIRKKQ